MFYTFTENEWNIVHSFCMWIIKFKLLTYVECMLLQHKQIHESATISETSIDYGV